MKKVLFTAVAASFMASSMFAQDNKEQNDRPKWYIAPTVGVMIMPTPVDNLPVMGTFTIGRELTERWAIEAGFMYAPWVSADRGANYAAGPAVDVLYHLLDAYSKWDIYLSAGLAYWWGNDDLFNTRDSNAFVPRLGAGVAYHLSDNLSLRLAAKVGIPLDAQQNSKYWPDALFETVELGLLYRFGGSDDNGGTDNVMPVPSNDGVVTTMVVAPPVVVDVTPIDSPDTMILETYINFGYDQAVIGSQYYSALNDVVRTIKKAQAKNPNVTVLIEGHADRRHGSSRTHNQDLSQRRADAVKNYFESQGIKASILSSVGYGFDKPKVTPNLDKGNPENRRVDVTIKGVGDHASRQELKAK